MNNTCTEEAETFHKLLDEKIEEIIQEADILIKESYDETGDSVESDSSFLDYRTPALRQNTEEFNGVCKGKIFPEELSSELESLFHEALLNAMCEGFLKGYLVGRLDIRPGDNPYNWNYLGKKFFEITERRDTQEREGQS